MSWSHLDTWIAIAAMILIVCIVFMALMWNETNGMIDNEQDDTSSIDDNDAWSNRE